MTTTRTVTLSAPDGGTFAGHLAVPDAGSGPGLLVLQEIFGVNDYIRDVCDRLAAMGYAAMAPDVFWRVEPGVSLGGSEADIATGAGYVGRLDMDQVVADLGAALTQLRELPESDGRAGVIGFCFGGSTTFRVASRLEPDVAVSYYGSGVGSMLDDGAAITCPLLFQYGSDDPFIPPDEIEAVREFAAERANVDFHTHDAGHAFDNHRSAMFSNPVAAAAAWEVTSAFLAEHLPV